MAKRYLRKQNCLKTVWWVEEDDGTWYEETDWNVDQLLDDIAAEANAYSATTRMGEFEKVASMPIGMYFDLQAKGMLDDPEDVKRILNDADNARLKTKNVRV